MVVYYRPEENLRQFQSIIDQQILPYILRDKSKSNKIPYDSDVAMKYKKEKMKLPTFNCRPIPFGAKLFDVEYYSKDKCTNVRMNINVIKNYFNSSSFIECSLQKFGRNESTSSQLEMRGEPEVLHLNNQYSAKIHRYG